MRKILVAAAVLLVFAIALSSTYIIEGSFDDESLTLHATLTAVTPATSFNLYPNLHEFQNPYVSHFQKTPAGWIEIERVLVNGKEARFSIKENPADLGQEYSKSHAFLVVEDAPAGVKNYTMVFTLHFPKGEMQDEGCWESFCVWRFGWYPIEIFPEKEGKQLGIVYAPHSCSLNLNLPKGWKLVTHQGTGIGCPLVLLKGYKEYKLVGRYYTVKVHYLPGREERAALMASLEMNALDRISKRFGFLDYKEINIVESPFSGLYGLAAPGVIVLGDNAFTTADLIVPGFFMPLQKFLLLHESAHMWFGLGAGVDFMYDNFLSESLSQYVSITEIEKEYGPYENVYDKDSPDAFAQQLSQFLLFSSLREQYLYTYRNLWRLGLDTSVAGKPEFLNQSFPIDYAKGYFAMRTLSLEFNDFDAVLKQYHEKFKGKIVSYRDFRNFLESVKRGAGKLADRLFLGKSDFDASVSCSPSGVKVNAPDVPYELLLCHIREGKEVCRTVIERGSVDLDGSYTRVEVDPRWLLPDPDRFNNSCPVKFFASEPLLTEESTPISPLEGYQILPSLLQVSITENEIALSAQMGIRKFDEWGFYIGGGSLLIGNESGIYSASSYLLSLSGFVSPNPLISIDGAAMFEMTDDSDLIYPFYIRGLLDVSIPEELYIGYSSRYFTARNFISVGGVYTKGYLPMLYAYHTFSDFTKLPLLTQIGAAYYIPIAITPFLSLYYFPTDFSHLHLEADYSLAGDIFTAPTGFPQTETYSGIFQGDIGLHANLDFFNRTNILNLASLRGIILGISGGTIFGLKSSGYDLRLTASMSMSFKLQSILDMTQVLSLIAKVYINPEDWSLSSALLFGTDISDYILASFKTAFPGLKTNERPPQPDLPRAAGSR